MAQPAEKPRVGLLGLTLELYEQLAPGSAQAPRGLAPPRGAASLGRGGRRLFHPRGLLPR